jgi:hypothetical protein
VAEARFFLLKMLGAEHPSPLAAYLEGARSIEDVKRFPPVAELQSAWTTASHALRDPPPSAKRTQILARSVNLS